MLLPTAAAFVSRGSLLRVVRTPSVLGRVSYLAAARCASTDSRPRPAMSLQDEVAMKPDLVLLEEKTGLPPGMPLMTEEEIWANPDALVPERLELWWDDGVAEPEYIVDVDPKINTYAAFAQLVGMISLVAGVATTYAWMIGDFFVTAAPRRDHMPFDLTREYGTKYYISMPGGKHKDDE